MYRITYGFLWELSDAEHEFLERYGQRKESDSFIYFDNDGAGPYNVASTVEHAKLDGFDISTLRKRFLKILHLAIEANGGEINLAIS